MPDVGAVPSILSDGEFASAQFVSSLFDRIDIEESDFTHTSFQNHEFKETVFEEVDLSNAFFDVAICHGPSTQPDVTHDPERVGCRFMDSTSQMHGFEALEAIGPSIHKPHLRAHNF